MKTLDFRRINTSIAVYAALLALAAPAAFADKTEEVARLYKNGNLAKALEQADAYLAAEPKDAQMRFHKGLILTEQKKTADAIKIFSSLAQDYPDLPEPYNNLAVLYASQGQYEKAKGALEAAIRTHPSYSTAHENLGDIYAKMASQAYGKALQLDHGNAGAQTKLAMIKDLFEGRPRGIQTASAPAASAPATAASDLPETGSKTAEPWGIKKKTGDTTAEKHAPKSIPEKVAVAEKPATEKPAVPEKSDVLEKPAVQEKPAVPEKPAAADNTAEVINTVNAWAKAWSDKNIAAYLEFYGRDFRPSGGVSRAAWEKTRQDRIDKPKSIHVGIANPKVSFADTGHATVSFKQSYQSDALKSTTNKTLEMVKAGGKWLIQQEQVRR